MKVYELNVKTFLLEDLKKEDVQKELAKLINGYLALNEKFLAFHEEKNYKPYCFDSLYPIKNFYAKENLCQFRIRSIDKDFVNYLLNGFENYKNYNFKNLLIKPKVIKQDLIDKIYTLNSLILKSDEGYWRNNLSVDEFEKRIKENIFKKYKYFTKNEIEEKDFYDCIKFLNSGPIPCKFKNITLLGDKIELNIKPDKFSQEIAYFSLGVTFSENNSYGFGFEGYKLMERS